MSILLTGKKEGKNGSDDILKTFNFDLATGELVPLEKLLGNDKKMWDKVAEITAKQGNKVMQNTMKGYYFDGENFVFMQRNEEKQCMEQLTVPKKELKNYFNKNKIEIQN